LKDLSRRQLHSVNLLLIIAIELLPDLDVYCVLRPVLDVERLG
jgi:hypothetical protein